MPRLVILYLLWWVRLFYRIGHATAHWVLPSALRHRVAGAVAITPYLFWVWDVVAINDNTWPAIAVGAVITGLLLLLVHRAEARRAVLGR